MDIDVINRRVTEIYAKFAELENGLAAIAKFGDVTADIAALKADVADLKTKIEALGVADAGRLTTIESSVETLPAALSGEDQAAPSGTAAVPEPQTTAQAAEATPEAPQARETASETPPQA